MHEKQTENPIKECIRKNFHDIKTYNFNAYKQQAIILNSISKIQKKIEYYNFLGIQVFEKNEKFQRMFNDKLVRGVMSGAVEAREVEAFLNRMHNKIVPLKMQLNS